ncbi:Phosphoribosylglycinamide formyltransferase [hydrothermal vent metagenome]|uniref:phosphoribosylglycinamide formyltransferase 1 n=1 Tax=hydrothermal vent metagenome TaxID=652676 RepID=A0A3B0T4P7_9ZZZZ
MRFTAGARARVGILISGRGSNLGALIAATLRDDFPAQIVLVLSNTAKAGGLRLAAQAGIAARVIDHKAYESRGGFEDALSAELEAADVDIVCNAGFMRLLTSRFTERWRDRQLNIHPSLLPAYKGLNTHERAISDGVSITGCTVHIVREAMDEGPILAQAAVPTRPQDTAETLAARVLAAEHQLYPHALALFASGAARVVGERVEIAEGLQQTPEAVLYAPPLMPG